MKYNGRFGVTGALTLLSLLIGLLVDVKAFVPTPRAGCRSISVTRGIAPTLNRGLYAKAKVEEENFLLEEFKVANGERIHPYKILKINRSATRQEVKQAYRDLSRRYHPDGARHRDILPGSCNNLSDVRDHWERIKLSYEILSDTKMRKRFDRHEALADPGKAMQLLSELSVVVSRVCSTWELSLSRILCLGHHPPLPLLLWRQQKSIRLMQRLKVLKRNKRVTVIQSH
jgi:hypothetical protein